MNSDNTKETGVNCMESRWILLGLILIANAVLMIFLGKRKKGRCSNKVVGRITGVREGVSTDDEGFKTYSYDAEYAYEVNGEIYHSAGGQSYNRAGKIKVGGPIDVYYNPEMPRDHYVKGGKGGRTAYNVCLIIAGLICIAAAF